MEQKLDDFLETYIKLGNEYLNNLEETTPEWDMRSVSITHSCLRDFYKFLLNKNNIINETTNQNR